MIGHDYFWPIQYDFFNPPVARIPGLIFSWLLQCVFPSYLNINLIDFRSTYANLLITFIFLTITYLFSSSFFMSFSNKDVLKEKIFLKGILFFLCFLILSCPFHFLEKNISSMLDLYFSGITEFSVFCEYCFYLLFFFVFWNSLLSLLFFNNKFSRIKKIVIFFSSFILGFSCELFSFSTFFSLFFIFLIFFFFNRKFLKNYDFLFLIFSYFLGFCSQLYAMFSIGSIAANPQFDIISSFFQNISQFSLFIARYNELLICDKSLYFIFILLLSFYIIKNRLLSIQNLIISFSPLLGFLFACLLMFFTVGIPTHSKYLFERPLYHQIEIFIFTYIILFLLGIIYFNRYYLRKFFILFFLIIIFCLNNLFISNYLYIRNEKIKFKSFVYKIEKIMLLYDFFGETAILPYDEFLSFSDRLMIIPLNNQYINHDNLQKLIKNRYLSSEYFFYNTYFYGQYKHNMPSVIFVNDNLAYDELEKRLAFFSLDFNLKSDALFPFTNLRNISKNTISKNQIIQYENIYKNNPLTTKYKAFSYFTDDELEKAESLYLEYINKNPYDIDSYIMLKEIYKTVNDRKNYFKMCKKLVELDSTNVLFLYDLLCFYFDNNDYTNSLKIIEMMIELHPDFSSNYLNRAIIYNKLGEVDLVEDSIKKAKECNLNSVRDFDVNSFEKLYYPYGW